MSITSMSLQTYVILYSSAILVVFVLGVAVGIYWGRVKRKKIEEELYRRLTLTQSRENKFKRENEKLKEKLRRYLNYFVKIPEAVKNVNTHLSFDDLITSIIRLVKELIHTNQVEIYMYDQSTNCLKLAAAYGTNRGQSITFKIGEGVIGGAAETKLMLTKKQLGESGLSRDDNVIEMATPILFQGELLGVVGIGETKMKTEDDKRFFAMVADLAAVAFKNCEYLDTAKEEAMKDSLTGLFNKRYFFERAHEAMQKASNYDFSFSIFLFDIDHFKNYNDRNGHMAGDKLLKEMGKLLKENTRSVNTVARYGGEEFIVLLQNTDKKHAMQYAESIRKAIEQHPFNHRGMQPKGMVSVSGGVAQFRTDGQTIDEIIMNADDALYQSKRAGRNMVTQYEHVQFSAADGTE